MSEKCKILSSRKLYNIFIALVTFYLGPEADVCFGDNTCLTFNFSYPSQSPLLHMVQLALEGLCKCNRRIRVPKLIPL